MKDIFGNELELGDIVAFNPPHYKGLAKGRITNFSEKMVTVAYINTWNFPNANPDERRVNIKFDYPKNVMRHCSGDPFERPPHS